MCLSWVARIRSAVRLCLLVARSCKVSASFERFAVTRSATLLLGRQATNSRKQNRGVNFNSCRAQLKKFGNSKNTDILCLKRVSVFHLYFNNLEIRNACVPNLTWTHYRSLLRLADEKARLKFPLSANFKIRKMPLSAIFIKVKVHLCAIFRSASAATVQSVTAWALHLIYATTFHL